MPIPGDALSPTQPPTLTAPVARFNPSSPSDPREIAAPPISRSRLPFAYAFRGPTVDKKFAAPPAAFRTPAGKRSGLLKCGRTEKRRRSPGSDRGCRSI